MTTPRHHMRLVCGEFNATFTPDDADQNIAYNWG